MFKEFWNVNPNCFWTSQSEGSISSFDQSAAWNIELLLDFHCDKVRQRMRPKWIFNTGYKSKLLYAQHLTCLTISQYSKELYLCIIYIHLYFLLCYINKIKVKEEDIKSINHFIHDYLAFIYESLQNDERNGLQSSIREVINFLETTSSKKIYKEKLSDLHKLLSVLLYYITISLRSNSKKSNETILCYSKFK